MRVKQIATSVAAAFALGYGVSASALVSAPGAVAEAMWTQSTFRICAGDGVNNASTAASCASKAAPTFGPGGVVTSGNGLVFDFLTGTEKAGASARINGTTASTLSSGLSLATAFTVEKTVGLGFTAGTVIPAVAPTGQYAGGHSSSSGFALSPAGAEVLMHSQVQINSYGSDGAASSQQTLDSVFTFSTLATQTFELSWDGSLKRRAGIGQFGIPADNFASSDNSLSFTVEGVDSLGNSISCSWTPDGGAGGISCSAGATATELADPTFVGNGTTYQNGHSISTVPFDFNTGTATGYWEAEFVLPAGFYTFTIGGQTQANAEVPAVPEPHSLALLGLGLLGLGFAARRNPRA